MPFFNDLKDMLFDFCKWVRLHLAIADTFPNVNNICIGRTVLRKNVYLNDFLPILYSNGRTINPVLALSASYRKEYFVKGSLERRQIEYTEFRYSMKTAEEVREATIKGEVGASTAVAAALLSHYTTLNPSIYKVYWTMYLYLMLDPAGVNLDANLAMTSMAILVITALRLNRRRKFQHFNYD